MQDKKTRFTHGESLPKVADTQDAALADLKRCGYSCTKALLQKAKSELGTRSFKSNRVYFNQDLLDWLEANAETLPPEDDELEPKEVLERRKLREQFLKAKAQRLTEERKLIPIAELKEKCTHIVASFRAATNGLRADAPQWAGMPSHEILRRVTEQIDATFRELEGAFRKLSDGR